MTDPSCVQLYVTEIVEHLKDSLPLKATLFLDSDQSDCPLPCLPSEIVTLKHTDVESFVIATTCWDENDAIPNIDSDHDDLIPVAIPTDLKISVTLLADQSENESLYEDTRQLYETFDPSNVYAVASSDNSGDYTALKYSVRSGHEYQGLDIIKPSKIYTEPEDSCSLSINTARVITSLYMHAYSFNLIVRKNYSYMTLHTYASYFKPHTPPLPPVYSLDISNKVHCQTCWCHTLVDKVR